MRRITIFIYILTFSSLLTFSQTIDEQKKNINTIKKSSAYLYAETTLDSEQDAINLAQDLLYQKINEYVAKKKKFKNAKETVVINQNYETEQIRLPRGNMYRAFVYVKKSDILPSENAIVGKLETTKAPHSSYEKVEDVTSHNTIKEICDFKTLSELKQKLPLLKQEGKIVSYASYSDLANPENFILIIYDKQGEIKAVLSEGKQRKNLITNIPEDIRKYKGNGAVGVKIK